MNGYTLRSFCLLLFLLPWAVSAFASEDGAGGGVNIRLLVWSEVQSQALYVQTDAEVFERLDLRANRRSRAYGLKQAQSVRIFTDGVDGEGNPIKVPVVEAVLSPEIREPLLILFSAMNAGKPVYRALVMEDAEKNFPFGAYRVMNLTENPLAFEFDGKVRQLASRATAMVQPEVQQRENIPVRFYVLEDEEPKLIRQTFWRHEPDQRLLIFVLKSNDPQRRKYVLRTLSERKAVYERLHPEEDGSENGK